MPIEVTLTSEATKDGKVKIALTTADKTSLSIEVPGEEIPKLACRLLEDARRATGDDRTGVSLEGSPIVRHSGIALSNQIGPAPTVLVVHLGRANLGIPIAKPSELGQALLAVGAPKGKLN